MIKVIKDQVEKSLLCYQSKANKLLFHRYYLNLADSLIT